MRIDMHGLSPTHAHRELNVGKLIVLLRIMQPERSRGEQQQSVALYIESVTVFVFLSFIIVIYCHKKTENLSAAIIPQDPTNITEQTGNTVL